MKSASLEDPLDVFDHLIVTAPSELIANQYQRQLDQLKQKNSKLFKNIQFHGLADPEGKRVGSGGGTLNAIDFLASRYGREEVKSMKVLVFHSGGESRRAPIHSVCGKAWANINILIPGTNAVANPIYLLLIELSNFFKSLSQGAVVVACADVILDLYKNNRDVVFPADAVAVVAVPADLHTAKNHGVLVVDNREHFPQSTNVSIAVDYLQKPLLEELSKKKAILPGTNQSMIDTGVVFFTGKAFGELVDLVCDEDISIATSRLALIKQNTFATLPSVSSNLTLDLYVDILFSFRGVEEQTFSEYLQRLKYTLDPTLSSESIYSIYKKSSNVKERSIAKLWGIFHSIALHVVSVSDGVFIHLGTTGEYLDLVTNPPTSSLELLAIKSKFEFQQCINSQLSLNIHGEYTVFSSRFTNMTNQLNLNGSLIEYSLLSGNISIGSGSIISHISDDFGSDLKVNSNIVIQQIPLNDSALSLMDNSKLTEKSYPLVHIIFSLLDDVKAHYSAEGATICGMSWTSLFSKTGLFIDDIWPNIPYSQRSLWTAKLYILNYRESNQYINTIFDSTWLQNVDTDSHVNPELIKTWKDSIRLSLADILVYGDAFKMFAWREAMSSMISNKIQEVFEPVACVAASHVPTLLHRREIFSASRIFYCAMHLLNKVKRVISLFSDDHLNDDTTNVALLISLSLVCVYTLNSSFEASLAQKCWEKMLHAVSGLNKESKYSAKLASIKPEFFSDILFELSEQSPDSILQVCLLLQGITRDQDRWIVTQSLVSRRVVDGVLPIRHPRLLFIAGWLVNDLTVLEDFRLEALQNAVDSMTEAANNISSKPHALSKVMLDATVYNESPSELFGRLAQKIVSNHIENSLRENLSREKLDIKEGYEVDRSKVILVKSPARIDLAGGWSDTPPICYDIGGLVLNVAVNVGGREPILCASRFISEPVLRLKALRKILKSSEVEGDVVDCTVDSDCYDVGNTSASCTLLKAVLIALGIVHLSPRTLEGTSSRSDTPLSRRLLEDYGGGIEIACISHLPVGSGLGGSSIVAAAALKSVGVLIGVDNNEQRIIDLVSHVEQLMTTGGGWQDQVGAVYPGFKLTSSQPSLPLKLKVQSLTFSVDIISCFEERCYLVYTGQQRLAKNCVINCLRRYSLTPSLRASISNNAVSDHMILRLVEGAKRGAEVLTKANTGSASSSYDHANDIVTKISVTLREYWELKKIVASGSEPPHIKTMLDALSHICSGYSLAGAGGGGFAVVILKPDISERELHVALSDYAERNNVNENLSIHRIEVNIKGLNVEYLDNNCQNIAEFLV